MTLSEIITKSRKKCLKQQSEYGFARERIVFAEQKQSVPMSNSNLAKISVSCSVYDKYVYLLNSR